MIAVSSSELPHRRQGHVQSIAPPTPAATQLGRNAHLAPAGFVRICLATLPFLFSHAIVTTWTSVPLFLTVMKSSSWLKFDQTHVLPTVRKRATCGCNMWPNNTLTCFSMSSPLLWVLSYALSYIAQLQGSVDAQCCSGGCGRASVDATTFTCINTTVATAAPSTTAPTPASDDAPYEYYYQYDDEGPPLNANPHGSDDSSPHWSAVRRSCL